MIANIRVLREGNFEFLCELDIMKYSQEQVLERIMKEELTKTTFLFVEFLIGKWIKSCR